MKQIAFQLILEYLKDNKCIESFIQLQRQSKIMYKQYPKEIQFFKKIMLKGDFSEAIQFIWTFEHKIDRENLSLFTLKILKQKLYQLLENPQQQQLKNLFEKQIVEYCSQEQYQQLFTYLTCRSVKQIPYMDQWTPIKGRFACFEQIVPYLQSIFVNGLKKSFTDKKKLHFKLQDALKVMSNLQNSNNISSLSINRQSLTKISQKQQQKSQKRQHFQKQSQIQLNMSHHNSQKLANDHPSQIQMSQSRVEKSEAFLEKSALEHSSMSRKINTYVGNTSNSPSGLIKSRQIQKSKYSIKNEQKMRPSIIDERKQIGSGSIRASNKSFTPSYLKQFQRQKQLNQSQLLQQQVKRNLAYLDQNNDSEVFKEQQNQNFTFSHGADDSSLHQKPKKILKLATISDPKAIRTCQFSPSGQYFALGTNSSFLKIFNVQQIFDKNQPKDLIPQYQIPQLHTKSIFSLDWSTNQKCIVTCSNDLTIKITDFVSDTYRFSSHRTNVIGRHQSCIRMVKFNPSETKVVSCGDDCLLKVWDIGKIKKCMILKGHQQGVSAFKFSQNEGQNILHSVGKDSVIRKWDIRAGQLVNTSAPQDSQMTYIANNIDRIVVAHKNGCVSFFDDNLQLQNTFKVHQQQIRSIDGNAYDQNLLTASFDGHISIFNEKTVQNPNYHQHNEMEDDKVVFATFMNHPQINGFASTSTLGLCNIFSYQ